MLNYRRLQRITRLARKGPQKAPSVLHPLARVPLTPSEWEKLKDQLFTRSNGHCEAKSGLPARRCNARIFRASFEPHHILSRAHGGADTLDNLLACCHACHEIIDGRRPMWRTA